MIDRKPREGYGYGIIRISHKLASVLTSVAELELMSTTDMMGNLKEQGVFDRIKQQLYLPDDYTIMGIYLEPSRRTWCVLLEAPGIPIPDEGADLPVLKPIYKMTWDFEKNTYQWGLKHIEVSADSYYVLKVD